VEAEQTNEKWDRRQSKANDREVEHECVEDFGFDDGARGCLNKGLNEAAFNCGGIHD
jgi:hypothetical protein